MESTDLKGIEAIVNEFIKKLDLEANVDEMHNENMEVIININTPNSALMIGKEGRNLHALNYLTKIIIRNKLGLSVPINLDIAGYQERKKANLLKKANDVASRARETGKIQELYGLTPAERRIIHMTLSEQKGIKTQSHDQGNDRILMVIPISEL